MKKILILILFLVFLFPVFSNAQVSYVSSTNGSTNTSYSHTSAGGFLVLFISPRKYIILSRRSVIALVF